MKTISWLFWKNVYHNMWLYNSAWLWYFCFNKKFRADAKLRIAIHRVEYQDELRVYVNPILYMLQDLRKVVKDATNTLLIIQSIKED